MKLIPLTNGLFAKVDDEDYERLSKHKWYSSLSLHYARRAEKASDGNPRRWVYMHREINNTPLGLETDHLDGDGLNNQKVNLRSCTHGQNIKNQKLRKSNKSGFKGVSWSSKERVWLAYITASMERIHLGRFSNKEDAAHCYDNAALEHFGKFAHLNFPLASGEN